MSALRLDRLDRARHTAWKRTSDDGLRLSPPAWPTPVAAAAVEAALAFPCAPALGVDRAGGRWRRRPSMMGHGARRRRWRCVAGGVAGGERWAWRIRHKRSPRRGTPRAGPLAWPRAGRGGRSAVRKRGGRAQDVWQAAAAARWGGPRFGNECGEDSGARKAAVAGVVPSPPCGRNGQGLRRGRGNSWPAPGRGPLRGGWLFFRQQAGRDGRQRQPLWRTRRRPTLRRRPPPRSAARLPHPHPRRGGADAKEPFHLPVPPLARRNGRRVLVGAGGVLGLAGCRSGARPTAWTTAADGVEHRAATAPRRHGADGARHRPRRRRSCAYLFRRPRCRGSRPPVAVRPVGQATPVGGRGGLRPLHHRGSRVRAHNK